MTSSAESHSREFNHINGTEEERRARSAVTEICKGWPLYRDASEWMNFRSLFCKIAYVWTTWSGRRTIDEFIEISKAGKDNGAFIMHRECGTGVELSLSTNRAVGKMKAIITQRFKSPEGVEYDIDCDCQFFFFCQRDSEDNWNATYVKLIYMKDKIVPVDGKNVPNFDKMTLDRFPKGYKYLGAAQSMLGHEIDVNLATANNRESWKRMYGAMEEWLAGHDATLSWNDQCTPDLTQQVITATGPNADRRLKEIASSLIRHLHCWARDVRLTHADLASCIDILLNESGRATKCDVQLFFTILGIDSLVDDNLEITRSSATSSAILGPFYQPNAPLLPNGSSIVAQNYSEFTDQHTHFSGHVLDSLQRPIEGAILEVWQAAPNGMYEQQDVEQPEGNLRGKFKTDAEGTFEMYCLKPGPYQVPHSGLAGRMLKMLDRPAWRPAHIHVKVNAKGFHTLTTQLYVTGDEHLNSDAAFAVKKDLVVEFKPRADHLRAKWSVKFDFILVSEEVYEKEH